MLERREEILSLLRTQEKVTVHELSEHFHCSEVTIRTDLRELESEGRLERTHLLSASTASASMQASPPSPTLRCR